MGEPMQWALPKNPMDSSSPVMRDRGQGGSRSAWDEKAVYGTELQRVRARSHNAWEAGLKGYMEGAECARIARKSRDCGCLAAGTACVSADFGRSCSAVRAAGCLQHELWILPLCGAAPDARSSARRSVHRAA